MVRYGPIAIGFFSTSEQIMEVKLTKAWQSTIDHVNWALQKLENQIYVSIIICNTSNNCVPYNGNRFLQTLTTDKTRN